MKTGTKSGAGGGRRKRRETPRAEVRVTQEPSDEAVLRGQLRLLGYSTPEIERLIKEREERLRREKGGGK